MIVVIRDDVPATVVGEISFMSSSAASAFPLQ